jgi:chloramphenicol-sensitive protein RarD
MAFDIEVRITFLMREEARGAGYAVIAFAAWGVLPVYWKLLERIAPLDILANRVIWALAFVGLVMAWRGRRAGAPDAARRLPSGRELVSLAASSALIAVNWGIYIWAVNSGQTVEASLGYYMNPLFSIVLGLVFLRERLKPAGWVAFSLACAGVASYALSLGRAPWIALVLMASFGFYGLLKKGQGRDAIAGLAFETAALAPFALLNLGAGLVGGSSSLYQAGPLECCLLVAAGPVTALPLIFFAKGAKAAPLSTVGFIQFLAPSLQLAIGVLAFGENFGGGQLASFGLVWTGIAVYVASLVRGGPGEGRP